MYEIFPFLVSVRMWFLIVMKVVCIDCSFGIPSPVSYVAEQYITSLQLWFFCTLDYGSFVRESSGITLFYFLMFVFLMCRNVLKYYVKYCVLQQHFDD